MTCTLILKLISIKWIHKKINKTRIWPFNLEVPLSSAEWQWAVHLGSSISGFGKLRPYLPENPTNFVYFGNVLLMIFSHLHRWSHQAPAQSATAHLKQCCTNWLVPRTFTITTVLPNIQIRELVVSCVTCTFSMGGAHKWFVVQEAKTLHRTCSLGTASLRWSTSRTANIQKQLYTALPTVHLNTHYDWSKFLISLKHTPDSRCLLSHTI
jgi:hypothetical protein